eukprot:m.227887 g.227887  ORF g.227887 m.227887 type:complete len:279 (-) comp11663_c0_seq1:77-913(-)
MTLIVSGVPDGPSGSHFAGMAAVAKFGQRLKDRVAIVTASTDGIGYAIAERLGLEGARVVISSRKQGHVNDAVARLQKQKIEAFGIECHVGNADHRKRLFTETVSKYGGLDILVSNAAVNPVFCETLETPEDGWDKIFDINLKASFLLAKEAYPHLKQSKHASLVFVSSIAGFNPFVNLGAYSISKTSLFALTKVLAAECGPHGIRVNALAPGVIKTRFSEALWKAEGATDQIMQQVPLGRLGEPQDCAGVVAFLCSDDAAYVTGETIVAAGGMTSRL